MKKYAFALIAAAALSAPASTAFADPFYVSFSGGLGLMNDSNAEVPDTATSTTTKWDDAVKYKQGYAFEAAFGEKQGTLRGELAVGYQSNDVDKILGKDIASLERSTEEIVEPEPIDPAEDALEQWGLTEDFEDLSIKASALTVMYNLYADYEMNGLITPYLMGGLGAAFVNMDVSYKDDGVKHENSYNETKFAWQVRAGLGVRVTNNMNVDLSYRYFNTGDIDFGSNAKLSFSGSKILLGMRYNL